MGDPSVATNGDNTYTFQGWMGHDKGSIGNLKWETFEPKPWEEGDVDIKITHSGICGSDLHTLRSGWVRDSPRN
jgi:alcohol dehydrogenase (NADP+)